MFRTARQYAATWVMQLAIWIANKLAPDVVSFVPYTDDDIVDKEELDKILESIATEARNNPTYWDN